MYENNYHNVDLSKFSFLITGGAGFIGSHLVEYLLNYNPLKVRVLDNLSTGNIHNLTQFKDKNNFEFIEGDIRNIDDCTSAMDGIDYVLHNAALGSVPRSINDPKTSNDVNIGGFLNILNAARDSKIKRLIYASSSSAYGNLPDLPKVEDKIGVPISPYAVTKYTNELYANVFSSIYGMQIIGLRYFNVFGPRQNPLGDYAAVIPKFIGDLLTKKSPHINGDGTYSRDFTFVENVVQMNIKALFVDESTAINEVYNTAFGEQTSLLELIDIIKENIDDSEINKIIPIFGTVRQGDVPHSLACIKKARKKLNYNPLFSVKEGLKITVDWYKNLN